MSELLERLTSPDQRKLDDQKQKNAQQNHAVIIGVLIVLCISSVFSSFRNFQQPKIGDITISQPVLLGPSELCPGDHLIYQFEWHGSGLGVLDFDATIWRVDPPLTDIFSDSLRDVLPGNSSQMRKVAWPVPYTYHDLATDSDVPLPPGNYERLIAITSPSRSLSSDAKAISFTIKKCPSNGSTAIP